MRSCHRNNIQHVSCNIHQSRRRQKKNIKSCRDCRKYKCSLSKFHRLYEYHFRWTSSLPFNDQVVCNRISWHCFRFTATLKIYFEKCDGDCFLGEEILVSSAGREVESHVEYKMGKSWLIVKLSLKLSRRLTNGKDEKETPRLSCCCRQMIRVDIQREKAM